MKKEKIKAEIQKEGLRLLKKKQEIKEIRQRLNGLMLKLNKIKSIENFHLNEKIIKFRKQGMSLRDIGLLVNRSHEQVRIILKKNEKH